MENNALKSILISVLSLTILLTVTSCQKERLCTCTYEANDTIINAEFLLDKDNEDNQRMTCTGFDSILGLDENQLNRVQCVVSEVEEE